MTPNERDRDGEIFENDVTNDDAAHPPAREQAAHHLRPDPGIDSQEADERNPEFAEELKRTGHASGH
jgi:hypothetical protein